ncbi:cation diffusion facilitator family transporter [Glaesserella sp.]|uniref:cation diffusion facilitator family transporter n=1 Tax=Glaesserella sp. TaxID=2094731 RepID=UPI00359FBC78
MEIQEVKAKQVSEQEHTHSEHSHTEHSHSHMPKNKTILGISLAIISSYMVIEFIGGYLFNSLTLMADAGHMANDSLSLLLALVALFLSSKAQKRFALLNGASLVIVAGMIVIEAFERWREPSEIVAVPMIIVATIGLLVNILVARIMLKSDQDNLNIKAAYLHVMADLFGSVVAIIAGFGVLLFDWQWIDIVASVMLSLLVLRSGLSIVKQAVVALRNNSDQLNSTVHNH